MPKIYLRFFLLGLFPAFVYGQFADDFSQNLDNWQGDLASFIINDQQQLQLQAMGGGTAHLYRSVDFPVEWTAELYLMMDFSPSNNNRMRWYLAANSSDLNQADAYYLELGENGSSDALTFMCRKDGEEILLARGKEAAIATKPAMARIKVDYTEAKKWQLRVDYQGGFLLQTDLVSDTNFDLSGTLFTGLVCVYTSSRSNAFFFDDISLIAYEEDTRAPKLVSASVENQNIIHLEFDEFLDSTLSAFVENYRIDDSNIYPLSIFVENNIIALTFAELPTDRIFRLNYQSVADLQGNLTAQMLTDVLFISQAPSQGNLLINEILFNPKSDGVDYLELINNSDKILNLEGVEIKNSQSGSSSILKQITLFPNELIALAEDSAIVKSQYSPPLNAVIEESELPAFNNDTGNATVLWNEEVIDNFDYSEDFHSPILSDSDGVSLERIFLTDPTNDPDNWTSAVSTTQYGTPGYHNSASIRQNPGEEVFTWRYRTFSPNNDGEKDVMLLDHNLSKSNFVLNAKIFNDQGFLIRDLYNNKTIPARGSLLWDGLDNNNQEVAMGIYLIILDLFHPDGDSLFFKDAFVLARRLD